jgi:hypothetical protein
MNCQIDWTKIKNDDKFIQNFIRELNVFYVGGTRARKSVSFTYSISGLYSTKNHPSCLLNLRGLEIIQNQQ